MRMTTDKMYYGNPRFGVEFDSGSETWSNQLTVWIAEKADVDVVTPKQFGTAVTRSRQEPCSGISGDGSPNKK